MEPDRLKQMLHEWLEQHYPELDLVQADRPLGYEKLLRYYEHMEVALLELKLLDECSEYLTAIRKRRAYLRRIGGGDFKKEQFRSLSAF